jgi:hypothetical protein
MKQTDKATHALEEAEKLLLAFSSAHHRVRHQNSRVFRDGNLSEDQFRCDSRETCKTNSGGYGRDSDPAIKRIQADIALQVN